MRWKTGVVPFMLHDEIHLRLPVIDGVWMEVTGHQALCTSARDGRHRQFSGHYKGKALDLRVRETVFTDATWPKLHPDEITRITLLLKERLGDEWLVLFEGDHFHVEYLGV